MNQDLYKFLTDVARRRDLASYSSAAEVVDLDMSNPAERNELASLLGEITTHEVQQGRPMLSAVVMHRQGSEPGQGFYILARQLGRYKGGDRDVFFQSELRAVHEFWAHQDRADRDL